MDCALHMNHRHSMTTAIHAITPNIRITLNLLLSGYQKLTFDANSQIFIASSKIHR